MSTSWAERWRAVLLGDPEDPQAAERARRVQQGVAAHRSGRVSDVRLVAGRLTARVQWARATPYLVEVEIPVLTAEQWDVVIGLLAGRVGYRAQLLAGQHPDGLVEEADEHGVALFPRVEELQILAGHSGEEPFPVVAAAAWEAVAVQLETSPFPLLKLRGRGRERLLRDLSQTRRGAGGAEEGVQVAELQALGWTTPRRPLESVGVPSLPPPRTAAPELMVLGDPEGWEGALSAHELFAPLIVAAGERAARLLEAAEEPSDPA